MELKHSETNIEFKDLNVLIVPYGIETPITLHT